MYDCYNEGSKFFVYVTECEDSIGAEENEVNETSAPLVSCLQPTDFAQHISDQHENEILCVAPAEGNRPESVKDKEAECFPLLFPDGGSTLNSERPCKLGMSQYIKSRLYSADSKFARNVEYIFYLQYLKEFTEVVSSAKVSMRKGKERCDITLNEITSAEELQGLFHRNEGYKYLSKVRGSAPYWEKTMKDLCAMVKQLGIPTWFGSFSAADRRWAEIAEAILKV